MDLATNSIFVSRDVFFYEHIFPFASGSSSSSMHLYDSPSFDTTSFVFPHLFLILAFQVPIFLFACLNYSNLTKHYKQFVMAVDSTSPNPTSFHEAVQSPDWRVAMDKDIAALELTNTWTLTNLPPGKVPIGYKWVCRTKYKSHGSSERHKARLVAKGYT